MGKSVEDIKKEVQEALEKMPSAEERKQQYLLFKQNIQRTLFYFSESNLFMGALLQEMDLAVTEELGTAAIYFDKKSQKFKMLFNPFFFNKMPLSQQMGVFHHEILHFTNNHLFRLMMKGGKDEQKLMNIAADMSINQYINDLPQGCVNVAEFQLDDGSQFPLYKSAEEYYELLQKNKKAQEKVEEKYGKGSPNGETLDEHHFDDLTEEEKEAMASEMKKLVKRSMDKTRYGKDDLPGGLKDLLIEIDTYLDSMNYKKILQQAIKKHASSVDRASTWLRPSKYYGLKSKGTTLDKLPNLNMYLDTSGSISVVELNQFLKCVNGFLKAGTRNCQLGFWHTSLYHKRKYKMNSEISKNEIESGGTDLTEVIADINKTNPDLSIILTDGYFGSGLEPKNQVIFVISDGGTMDHPLKNHPKCKTITLKKLI